MASDLAEQYREEGKDDLAEKVEKMEEELDGLLAEGTSLGEGDLSEMSLETKREIGNAIINGETTNADTVEYEMTNPVHGESRLNSETVEYERKEPRTYTEEVPIEGGDDPETVTREYKDYGPTAEEVIEWKDEHLNADQVDDDDSDIPAPGEVSRERQDDDGPQ